MQSSVGRRVIGALISVAATIATLEAAIRVFPLMEDNVPLPYRALAGEEGFGPVPNESARSLYGVRYRTNSQGLRGAEQTPARIPGRARVAVLGDSVVFGLGIPEEATLPVQLEQLADKVGVGLEAWNLGVPANNTYNEKARYARLASLIRPDVTIVVVLFNDLEPGPAPLRVTSARTLSNVTRRAPYPDAWRPLLEQSALFHALIRIYAALRREDQALSLADLPGVLTQLEQIRATAQGVGSTLIVAAMPGRWPDPARFAGLAEGLKRFCVERELPFVDLSSVLGNPVRSDYFLPSDSTHPTAEGSRLIAEALLPRVTAALRRRPDG
ncbi:MAG TPA: GDSL-type esterase/lipase family protein [Casimicrobiaceae bacterium]